MNAMMISTIKLFTTVIGQLKKRHEYLKRYLLIYKTDFILLGYRIISDGDCNHEIKIAFLLRRKVMTNLDSIL